MPHDPRTCPQCLEDEMLRSGYTPPPKADPSALLNARIALAAQMAARAKAPTPPPAASAPVPPPVAPPGDADAADARETALLAACREALDTLNQVTGETSTDTQRLRETENALLAAIANATH